MFFEIRSQLQYATAKLFVNYEANIRTDIDLWWWGRLRDVSRREKAN